MWTFRDITAPHFPVPPQHEREQSDSRGKRNEPAENLTGKRREQISILAETTGKE